MRPRFVRQLGAGAVCVVNVPYALTLRQYPTAEDGCVFTLCPAVCSSLRARCRLPFLFILSFLSSLTRAFDSWTARYFDFGDRNHQRHHLRLPIDLSLSKVPRTMAHCIHFGNSEENWIERHLTSEPQQAPD